MLHPLAPPQPYTSYLLKPLQLQSNSVCQLLCTAYLSMWCKSMGLCSSRSSSSSTLVWLISNASRCSELSSETNVWSTGVATWSDGVGLSSLSTYEPPLTIQWFGRRRSNLDALPISHIQVLLLLRLLQSLFQLASLHHMPGCLNCTQPLATSIQAAFILHAAPHCIACVREPTRCKWAPILLLNLSGHELLTAWQCWAACVLCLDLSSISLYSKLCLKLALFLRVNGCTANNTL